MNEAIRGVACPKCEGRLEIPEGSRIIVCPYCDQRSLVRGERGVLRYQVARAISREQAWQALRSFLRGFNRAPDLTRRAALSELFVAYLPFWSVWARAAAWVFGEKQVGRGDRRRYEPREVRILRSVSWNAAACDVAEFGVEAVQLDGRPMTAFDAEALHADGMVFEPVGSMVEGERQAEANFEESVRTLSDLDRIASVFLRLLGKRVGLVYFPLWVARYVYRNRSFQVVIDGHSGQVLYGKAPGNNWYRAAALVGGMALGAFAMVDGTALALDLFANSSSDEGSLLFLLVPFVVGAALMLGAYRAFRFGEQIEHRARFLRTARPAIREITGMLDQIGVRLEL